jgi:release factor glutamine methyltransferase
VIRLLKSGLPRSDIFDILSFGAGVSYKEACAHPDRLKLPDGFIEEVQELLRQNTPVAYITGRKEFYSLELTVTRDTLIPRPDTETLVDAVLKDTPRDKAVNILDLCTGSGAILLALLANLPNACGVGMDISSAALEVARKNADKLGLADRCTFILKDIRQGFEMDGVDMLTSNPPYVAEEEYAEAEPSLFHEPRLALVPEGDTFGFYKLILSEMKKSGSIAPAYFEIAYNGGAVLSEIAEHFGYKAEIIKDLAHNDRVLKIN